jgi:hypothetical protein
MVCVVRGGEEDPATTAPYHPSGTPSIEGRG